MDYPMNFQAVVLAGGISKNLFPLVSKDVPKALLPVGNRPLLSYALELLEENNIKNPLVLVEGNDSAVVVDGWIIGAYDDRLHAEVVSVQEDTGTADALRQYMDHLRADNILVVSGDLVCDVPLGALAATHSRLNASMTSLLCTCPSASTPDVSSSKDKVKKQPPSDIIGLDPSHQYLSFMVSASQAAKELRIQRSILRAFGKMELHTDLLDAHLYVFKREILLSALKQRPGIHSIKEELVPYLLRSQLRLGLASATGEGEVQVNDVLADGTHTSTGKTPSQFHLLPTNGQFSTKQLWPSERSETVHTSELTCCAYVANKDRYCARLNTIQAFRDINHDVAGERAVHLTGYEVSKHNNVVHPTATLGYKSTAGPHCMLGDGSTMGDKSSIKRSIVGRHCRIGSGIKIMDSVVMNHVTLEDGCQIQGSVICSNAHVQERVILKDCQVGPAYMVSTGEYQAEALAKRERT